MAPLRLGLVLLLLLGFGCSKANEGSLLGDPWTEYDASFWDDDDPPPQPHPEGENEPPFPPEDPDAEVPEPPEGEPWPDDAGEPPPPPTPDGGPEADAGAETDAGTEPVDTGNVVAPEDGGPPPPPPANCRTTAGPLTWSCNGPIAGQSCVAITEPLDPHGWTDNYLCSAIEMGLRWSHAGPIVGMRCTPITEPADPNGWGDNFLCLPADSPFTLQWSVAGPIPGRVCHAWVEPSDPHTWTDNQLCVWYNEPIAGPPPVPPPPATGTPPPPRFQVVFSQRAEGNGRDPAIENLLIELIGRALPGSRLRAAVYTFTRATVAQALIAAHRRGVDVRVVIDGSAHLAATSVVPSLVTGLGRTRVTSCSAPGSACLGTGIMHHKTYLFSALNDGSRSVVVQTSYNPTAGQLRRHNDALVIRGDSRLFATFERTFEDQRRDTVHSNYYRIQDGYFRTRAYFHPRATGDTVVSILNSVDCTGGGRIRAAMAFFTNARLEVARALAARQRAGCTVEVVIGSEGIPPGRDVLATLREMGVRVTLYPLRSGWGLHSKYLLLDARLGGSTTTRRLVFTGSHNWTGPSLRTNDETLLRIDNAAVYDAYLANWGRVRGAASTP